MNHDDDKNPDLQTWIDPELEARLVAAVLGEASAFEQAELERLMAEKPELAIFKRRIEAVHGLLGRAIHPEEQPLQLSAERRAKVIETIGPLPALEKRGSRDAHILQEIAEARRLRRLRYRWSYGFAALVAMAALIMVIVVPSSQKLSVSRKYAVESAPAVSLQMPDIVADEERGEIVVPKQRVGMAVDRDALAAQEPRGMLVNSVGGLALSVNARGLASPSNAYNKYSGSQAIGAAAISLPAPSGETFKFSNQIGATNNQSLLNYTGNIETAGSNANFATQDTAPTASEPAEAETDDKVVMLDPMVVSETRDEGYAASSTLAGSRLRTNLGDFGAGRLASADNATFGRSAAAGKKAPAQFDANDGFLSSGSAGGGEGLKKPIRPDPTQTGLAAVEDKQLSAQRPAPATTVLGQGVNLTQETVTAEEGVSTFSLHVSDASYKLAQAAVARDEQPDPAAIRPEEFYNAFDYGDPAPAAAEKIACRIEQAAHPLLQQRNLLRIAMRVPTVGRGATEPLRLTVLLDTSGSMEREDRVASVQRALQVLAKLLGPNDRVTLIGFARQPRLLAEELPGNEAGKLAELTSRTPYTGGTNLEEGLKLAGELAKRQHTSGAQNRVVLITDGAANLGNSDPQQLAKLIEQQRQQGIAFDACGVGTDGLDDAVLEALTRKGDGRYYVLDRPEDADANFARQLAGAFRPAAENVKVQVRFNPARVARYRLIGFEQHRLKTEDFRNDKVDAAELAAGEAAVALYQVEVLPQGEGELGDVYVRFRDPATRMMVERSWTILHDPHPPAFDKASPTIQLAGTAALLAEKLRGGDAARAINLNELESAVNVLRGRYADDPRVQEFIAMFEKVRSREP